MSQPRMNWDQARSQLRRNEVALEEALAPSPRHIETVFHQRGLQLAKRRSHERPAIAGRPVLVCRLAREHFGIELKDLAEVLRFTGCTPVPGAPPQFLGVIHLRGEIRPVLDLGRVLAGSEIADQRTGFVVMLRQKRREIGLRVDQIEGLRQIQPEELALSEPGNYVKGLTSDALMLLSMETLLASVFPKEAS